MIHTSFKDLEHFFVGWDRLLDSFQSRQTGGYPPYNVVKTDDGYVVELAVAGFSRDDITVGTQGDSLIVKGSRSKTEEANFVYRGLATRNFSRVFKMSGGASIDRVTLSQGILSVFVSIEDDKFLKKFEIEEA